MVLIKKALNRWRKYVKNPEDKPYIITVFSPDEQFVLYASRIDRDDPLLIECVRTLREKANGTCSELEIVDIPVDIEYTISDYDGIERIEETHRSWG